MAILNLSSKTISNSFSNANLNLQRHLHSETIDQAYIQLYTKYQLLSFRRYSSQYFVQGGYSEDNGQ